MEHKKQAFSLIESICAINDKWGNPHGSYTDKLESSMQIEEAIEGFGDFVGVDDVVTNVATFSNLLQAGELSSRKLMSRALFDIPTVINMPTGPVQTEALDVDRFDKALDSIYIAIGSLHKLGLTPANIVDGLQVVHTANLQKLGAKDSAGKVTKSATFQPPESQLQLILDSRPCLTS